MSRAPCEPATGRGRPILSEALVLGDTDEPIGGIIVFLKDGYLSMLEIYSYGPEPIRTWPEVEWLRPILRDA